jgi:hypothetical protein
MFCTKKFKVEQLKIIKTGISSTNMKMEIVQRNKPEKKSSCV